MVNESRKWTAGEKEGAISTEGISPVLKAMQSEEELLMLPNQTEELCLEAIKQCGVALKWVREQTPEICLAAVSQNADALRFVRKQTKRICMAAVQKDWNALRLVRKFGDGKEEQVYVGIC